MLEIFRAVWSYRGFVLGSVQREFQSKYRNSMLGAVWSVLNPLAMIFVYTVIFTEVMQTKLPATANSFGYSIYLCSGVLTWGFFAEIVGRAQTVFIDNANLLKKLNFPRLCLPAVVVLSASLNFLIVFTIFTLFLVASGNFPGWSYLGVFPLLFLMALLAIGLGTVLGVLNVFFRDVGQFFGIFITFWFWLTPIVYPAGAVGKQASMLLDLNPMTKLIGGFQGIFIDHIWPDWSQLWPAGLLAIGFSIAGLKLFRSRAGEMVDEL
jgi:lipopolysaccharide transport system permease protein